MSLRRRGILALPQPEQGDEMAKNTNRLSRLFDRRRKPAKNTERVIAGVRKAFDDLGDRAAGGPEKRRIAAKKAAATRKRNAGRRSDSAKKAARTRAKGR
jgi:hypothetical protein